MNLRNCRRLEAEGKEAAAGGRGGGGGGQAGNQNISSESPSSMFCLNGEMLYLLQREEVLRWVVRRGEDRVVRPEPLPPTQIWCSCWATKRLGEAFNDALLTQPTDLDLTVHTQQMLWARHTNIQALYSWHTDKAQQMVNNTENKAFTSKCPLGHIPIIHYATGAHTWVKHPGRSSGLIMLFIRLESWSRHHASRESLHKDKRQCLHIQCKQQEKKI